VSFITTQLNCFRALDSSMCDAGFGWRQGMCGLHYLCLAGWWIKCAWAKNFLAQSLSFK